MEPNTNERLFKNGNHGGQTYSDGQWNTAQRVLQSLDICDGVTSPSSREETNVYRDNQASRTETAAPRKQNSAFNY